VTEPVPPHADLVVDPRVSREQEQPLAEALTALGFTLTVRELPPRRVTDPLTWLVLITLPLQAFLSALGQKTAESAFSRLQGAVHGLRHRPAGTSPAVTPPEPPRPLVLQDPVSGLSIVLGHDLPEEGYQQLLTLDLTRYRLGPLHYDRAEGRWRSELDEAASR
jgi:hypothetical protein